MSAKRQSPNVESGGGGKGTRYFRVPLPLGYWIAGALMLALIGLTYQVCTAPPPCPEPSSHTAGLLTERAYEAWNRGDRHEAAQLVEMALERVEADGFVYMPAVQPSGKTCPICQTTATRTNLTVDAGFSYKVYRCRYGHLSAPE